MGENLSKDESNLLALLRHFNVTTDSPVMEPSIIHSKDKFLSPQASSNIYGIIESLIAKDIVRVQNNGRLNTYYLTEAGTHAVYGPFDIKTGVSQFMRIFRHFNIKPGQVLNMGNIIAVRDQFLSPIYNERIDAIINKSAEENFITVENNLYRLTDTGEKQLYPDLNGE